MFITLKRTVEHGGWDIAIWNCWGISIALKNFEMVGEHCDVELLGKSVQYIETVEKVGSVIM